MMRSRVFCGAKTTCSSRLPRVVEGNVGDLLVLAIHLTGVFVQGVHLHRLAEGVVVACLGELALAFGKFLDDLVCGETGGRGGVELAEAGGILRDGKMQRRRKREGEQYGGRFGGQFHRFRTPSYHCGQTTPAPC